MQSTICVFSGMKKDKIAMFKFEGQNIVVHIAICKKIILYHLLNGDVHIGDLKFTGETEKILSNVKQLKNSNYNTLFLMNDGTLFLIKNETLLFVNNNILTDENNRVILPIEVKNYTIRQIYHRFGSFGIIFTNGFICLWGLNSFGQLGIDHNLNYNIPSEHANIITSWNNKKHTVIQLAFGIEHTLVLVDSNNEEGGDIFSFGKNQMHQLGNRDCEYDATPMIVEIKGKIKYIICGCLYSGCITTDNDIYMWGNLLHYTSLTNKTFLNIFPNYNYSTLYEIKHIKFSSLQKCCLLQSGDFHSMAILKNTKKDEPPYSITIWGIGSNPPITSELDKENNEYPHYKDKFNNIMLDMIENIEFYQNKNNENHMKIFGETIIPRQINIIVFNIQKHLPFSKFCENDKIELLKILKIL